MARHCYSLFFCVRLLIYVKAIQGDFPAGLQDSHRGQSGYSKRYINSWAVEVRSGKLHADEVARRNGFENRGRAPGFSDVYEFVLIGPERNRITSDTPYVSSLEAEKRVQFAEQQYYEERVTKSYVIPQDPIFTDQWNLLNTGQLGSDYEGNDLNVEPAWLQGLTGCNISISVVDNGIDHRHLDIWPNFTPAVSYDYVDMDYNPSVYRYNHGQSCAGIIGAAYNNSICVVGIAYDSNIGGLRLLGSSEECTDMLEAGVLSHGRDIVDIYSNSWGPFDEGFRVEGPRTMTQRALQDGISMGRDGKGSIYVWASGNGGTEGDDCAADGYVSSIYTIAVGSIGVDGSRSLSNDEECSAKMVAAYVTDTYRNPAVRTVDTGGNRCRLDFGGTSSATPMVSGAIALALEANPSLTWRDVQYLIVYTANPRKTPAPRTLNRAGLTVSRQYGFGVLDIEALVTRARHWINVPPQIEDKITDIAQQQILDNISYSGTVTYNGPIQYLEHVVVRISVAVLEDFKRGDLQIELTSPSGTLSILLMPRPNDALPSQSGYSDWPFMSVMFWGENPTGQWTLNIKTGDVSSGANVTNVVFQFYGVFQVPEAVANIPDQCHSDCRRGCAREGSNFCDSCVNLRNAYTLECINECPPGYTERNRYCYDASLPLKECNSPLKSKEGTRFTPGYEPIGCQEGGIDTCCADTDKDCNLFYPDHQCFCDDVCHNFDDCCGDVDQIGCTEQNVTHFPYIELGVTPGIETQHAVEKPMDVDFPYYYSLEETVSVGPDGYFNFGTDLSSLVGPFSSTGSIPGSASYEVHRGALSQNVLSQASSIVNANGATNFYAKWVLLATWETYAENNKTNTFQGMLATDFISSYTVFTYNCRDMSFSPPIGTSIIGFYHNDFPSLRTNHGATRREKPHLIACINQPSSPWVNVVYGLSADDSLVDECEMDNGGCEQICTDTFLSFGCSCTYGYVLNSDGVSCSEEPVELEFTGDTPMVTGSNISVMIHVSPARPLRCQLITRGASGMPIRTAEDKCSSGEVVFQNVPAGEHRVRVIAGNGDAVIRSFIVLMPDSPHFCSLNAINRGITKHHYNGTVSSYTIEWRAIGDSVGFLCDFGIPEYAEKCSSPYTFSAEDGVTRVKVLPDPEKCRGMRSPFVFRLD